MNDYEELSKQYLLNYSLGFLGKDINSKFALISLLGYLTMKIKEKKNNVTHLDIINKINNTGRKSISDKQAKSIAIVAEDFAYGCTDFLTFDLKDKEIPSKIKEILDSTLPFQHF